MQGKSFTPVSVRRRSAAQGCADAHTASAARAVVGPVESASALAEIWRFSSVLRGYFLHIKCCEMRKLNIFYTY